MGVADCEIGQLRKEANSKQISYMISIGMHETHVHTYILHVHNISAKLTFKENVNVTHV